MPLGEPALGDADPAGPDTPALDPAAADDGVTGGAGVGAGVGRAGVKVSSRDTVFPTVIVGTRLDDAVIVG